MCFAEFLLGLPCIFEGGIYWLQIMDWYCSTFSLMLLSLTECVVIGWIYGADRFYQDIELMIGYKPFIWWKICWKFITPVVIAFIWLFSVTQLKAVTYGDYEYPTWAIVCGWIMGLISLLPLPVCMGVAIYKSKEATFVQKVKSLLKPDARWGPAVEKYRELYEASLESSNTAVCIAYRADKVTLNSLNGQPETKNLVL